MAGSRRRQNHLEVVRKARDAGKHRIEYRLGRRPLRQCFGQPLDLRLVVLKQHCFLGRKVTKEGALSNPGLPRKLSHRHICEALACETRQSGTAQRFMSRLSTLLMKVRRRGHNSAMISDSCKI